MTFFLGGWLYTDKLEFPLRNLILVFACSIGCRSFVYFVVLG